MENSEWGRKAWCPVTAFGNFTLAALQRTQCRGRGRSSETGSVDGLELSGSRGGYKK